MTRQPASPWIPLMAGGGSEGIITEWKLLAALETDDRRRNLYAALALIFADRAGRRESWQQALKEWNMKGTSIIDEWQEEARVEARQDDLIRLLRHKFTSAITPDLIQKVEATKDSQELSRWFDVALAAASLEQFEAILGIGKNGTVQP